MATLSSAFSEEDRDDFVRRNTQPGTILYLHCPFTTPHPKDKFVLLLKLGNPSLIFIINSQIHPFVQSKPDLNACQMQLDCSTYTFFDHDSFVNCSEVKDNFDESEIIRQLGEDAERIMGPLKQSELASVIKKVQAARTLSPIQKNEIISSLRTIP